jgi:hypothetical protein
MANAEIHELRTENHKFETYVEGLGQKLLFKNNGKKLSDVGSPRKPSKLSSAKKCRPKSDLGQHISAFFKI